ncbi:MAG: hypothetical protein PHY92_00055 [Alphaproteobacteria bacterium]|nr:hypothetical protein [Alphaproteobacteria bacterium]
MLRYSSDSSRSVVFPLSADEDRKLRSAFGRFAETSYRAAGARVVSFHYEKQRCFHCDCRPDAKQSPLLFLVSGMHIRREAEGKGTPHRDSCDFAREPHEQKKLIKSYRRQAPEDEHRLHIVRNFGDKLVARSHGTSPATTNRSRPALARVLCSLLHEARLDIFNSDEPLHGEHEDQIARLKRAAANFILAPGQELSRWFATSLRDYYGLKKDLENAPKDWKRPHGLFIETFDRIENNTLYPKLSKLKPITVTGKLTVFGEGENLRRPPYLVIGLLAQPSRDAKDVELLNAYAHPCVAWNRLTLVDSQLERETLKLLMSCRDELTKRNIAITIEKPLYDIGPEETDDPREICLPDFVLRCRGQGVRHPVVVIETMGYNDPVYRERKKRMRRLFERIENSSRLVPVLEHDRFKRGRTNQEIDRQFSRTVCNVIAGPIL